MVTTLQKDYKERIMPALKEQFNYHTVMQIPAWRKSLSTRVSARQHRTRS